MSGYINKMSGKNNTDIRTIEEVMYEDFINSKNKLGPTNTIESLAPVFALDVIKKYSTYANPLTYKDVAEKINDEFFVRIEIKKIRRVVNTLILADTGVVSKSGKNKFYYFPTCGES